MHTNDFEISSEYMHYSNGIGKGININIDIWFELYLSFATKFAVYYTHIVRWLTGLKYCMQNAANTDSTVKKKSTRYRIGNGLNMTCLHMNPVPHWS